MAKDIRRPWSAVTGEVIVVLIASGDAAGYTAAS